MAKDFSGDDYERKWTSNDVSFSQFLFAAESVFRSSLEDNFDTVGAMKIIGDVVRESNQYMAAAVTRTAFKTRADVDASNNANTLLPLPSLVTKAAEFVHSRLLLFGVDLGVSKANWSTKETVGSTSNESGQDCSADQDALLHNAVTALGSLRSDIHVIFDGIQ